jgi:anti-sigma regulatory factor (Ser/Thr protein kinase)
MEVKTGHGEIIVEPDVVIAVQEKTHVALARRVALGAAKRAGLRESDVGSVGVVVTEAATNVLKHAGGGEIVIRIPRDSDSTVEILALDQGKGIANLAQSSQDGYSTAGSPGTGLGAIYRLSGHHDIYSARDQGTVLLAQIGLSSPITPTFVTGAICAPAPTEEVSGDAWMIQSSGDCCRVLVADGLGHGPEAAKASQAAMRAAEANSSASLLDFISIAHSRLRPTRGAALAIAEIRLREGRVAFSGAGNISGVIISDSQIRGMVSMNGTVGQEIRSPQEFFYPWTADSLLILHSDGIKSHWSLDRYPGLFNRHPTIIASVLFRDFRRGRDDATVVVVREYGAAASRSTAREQPLR